MTRNLEAAILTLLPAGVARLPTGLGIARRCIEHHVSLRPGGHGLDRSAIDIQRGDLALACQMIVTLEAGFAAAVRQAFSRLELAGRARLLAQIGRAHV